METEVRIESYSPNPSQRRFHNSSARFRCMIGAVRAGKTISGLWEGIDLNMKYERNQGLISRKTYRELKDTTQKSFFQQCPDRFIKDYISSQERVVFKNDSEVIFRSLDDIDKVKSLELGWFYIDEGTEVEHEFWKMLKSRLSLSHVPEHKGWITTNPPNIDHWIHEEFIDNLLTDYEIIRTNTYENRANLPAGYIESLEQSYDQSWINKYLMGEFGYDIKGKQAFYGFDPKLHMTKLEVDRSKPIIRGWDFGYRHPCVLFSQMNSEGRWILLKLIFGADIYIQDFAPTVMKLTNEWFPDMETKDFGDPAGAFKKDTSISTISTLKNQFGIKVESCRTRVESGIDIVNQKLNTLINGKPALMIARDETLNMIISIFQGAYYYKDKEETPYKDGYYEHPADTLRYTAVNLFGNRPHKKWSAPIGGPAFGGLVRV